VFSTMFERRMRVIAVVTLLAFVAHAAVSVAGAHRLTHRRVRTSMMKTVLPRLGVTTMLRRLMTFLLATATASATALAAAPQDPGTVTPAEARAIAKEAYVWGFPMVESYKTLYAQAIDAGGSNYRAPLNHIGGSANVFTPKDTAIVTPNSDTPYSAVWMDLRAEPLVLTIPRIDKGRYYSVQLIDLYTQNFDYIGSRTTGNDGGIYLVAGPGWKGATPPGVNKVFHAETNIVYAIYRTQLFNDKDIDAVRKVQAGYLVQPLSAYLKQPPPAAPPRIEFPPYDATRAHDLGFFSYLNFLLQFAPVDPSEVALRQKFAKIGIAPGKPFDADKLSPDMRHALLDGIKDADEEFANFKKTKVDGQLISSADLFGTRAFLKNNYLYRFAGAKMGIFGNSGAEANYEGYFTDADHQPLDGSKHAYVLHFGKDQLPPTKAFWSLTMYDGKSQLLVDNPLNRYLINSPMLPSLKRDADGGLTLYVQHDSPGKDKESNWLPTPNGPFFAVLRNYDPDEAVLNHRWKRPEFTRIP